MEVRVETSLRESPEFSGRKTVNVCEFVSRYAGIKTLRMVSDPRSSMYFHPGSGKFADSLDTLVVCPLRVHTRAESGPAVWQVSEELSVWRLDEALEIGLREEKQDQRPLRIVVECTLDKIEGWEEAEKACKDHGVSLSKDMRLD
ncbi:hypothetical protein GLOTRDRAFT_133247 [Gloeophyllum trabeum ATCC 11539]|uniref:Uncharacterized protein n=1 Tax=Gloeophyllum trabeum (strain ATCC 11539 / FP-39264 / Madison 617) TaxID=670483 RepID=S7PV40_GLOTA|nr:uncharacterized protein GLOTRDRAFT_133247 [Gloeophyllum trabeum ATCC 11539]EPQ51383.1 hypothetical protein GLOTRDRAFT_133247 [Gloeophyllum trabeum ATCC 11539]